MLIRMLKTERGAEDGFTLKVYLEGKEYEIGGTPRADDLRETFIREKWAERVEVASNAVAPADPKPAPVPLAPAAPFEEASAAVKEFFDGAKVSGGEGVAVAVEPTTTQPTDSGPAGPAPVPVAPKVMRLPLLEEYVAAGYKEKHYKRFIEQNTKEAALRGQTVEVRSPLPGEDPVAPKGR